MSYTPATDFLALVRQSSGGARVGDMPGLDYVVAALSRASMFRLWVGATPPIVNQSSTVWFKPANPSWSAEGNVFLWNAKTNAYELATPELWAAQTSPVSYNFQSTNAAAEVVNDITTLFAIQRAAPAATVLTLPSVAVRNGDPLHIVDWSTAVVNHEITLDPSGAETIMRAATWPVYSNAAQLGSVTLYPSIDLNGWVIAP